MRQMFFGLKFGDEFLRDPLLTMAYINNKNYNNHINIRVASP